MGFAFVLIRAEFVLILVRLESPCLAYTHELLCESVKSRILNQVGLPGKCNLS